VVQGVWRCCRLASSAESWVIVGTNGKPIADIRGDVPVFTCREEAEHCLMPGERVEQLSARVC